MMASFLDPEENPIIIDAEIVRDDTYSAQREEFLSLLKSCLDKNVPLEINERVLLSQDEIYMVLHKVRKGIGFSRKERSALSEAGFDLEKIYPDL